MKQHFVLLLLSVLCAGAAAAQAPVTPADALVDKLPSLPFLPEPLILDEGGKNIPVKTTAQWQQKRTEIRKHYEHWVSGSVPPPPHNLQAKVLSETVENNVKVRTVELTFGPGNRAKMTLQLMIPPSGKPLPVFMTQWNHRAWAQIAVRRGYIGCIYAGADMKDDTKNYGEIYPEYDFATLMKRAWGASRVVDYLYRLPEVDKAAIAITGHSRNGKQSLMAAAFDERIKAVVSGSGGTGGESTFRFSDERFDSESLEEITRNSPHWFNHRLRSFSGREQQLPVDQNSLMALVAPRGLMLVSAITEAQGNGWGIEQSYHSAAKAYHFLHADNNIAILLRRGRHQHSAREVEDFIDFFDYIFHRSAVPPDNKLYYGYSFERWQQLSKEKIDPRLFAAAAPTLPADSVRNRIRWLLGDEPAGIGADQPLSPLLDKNKAYPDDYLAEVIGQPALKNGIRKMEIGPYNALGDDLWGTIYFPGDAVAQNAVKGKLPLVIFLHEYSYATGSHRRMEPVIQHFTAQGYAVLTFDFAGFGTRIEEAKNFYQRYPHWSLMGKMVADTRSIVNDAYTRMPFVDTAHIYLAGYSLGGTVALFTAVLDTRVKGAAVASAFGSLRSSNKTIEGIKDLSHLHGLIPRLGFFTGHVSNIPIDFDNILECMAPRPLLIIAPEADRHYPLADVEKMVAPAAKTNDRLQLKTPADYNRFTENIQADMAEWLKKRMTD